MIQISCLTAAMLFLTLVNASQHEIEHQFIKFINLHGKKYSNSNEMPLRFETFKKNYKMVQENNMNADSTYEMEIN